MVTGSEATFAQFIRLRTILWSNLRKTVFQLKWCFILNTTI